MDEIFTKIVLTTGEECCIIECKGKHYFDAINDSGSDQNKLMMNLINNLVLIEGKHLGLHRLREMPIVDVIKISDTVNAMLANDIGDKFF